MQLGGGAGELRNARATTRTWWIHVTGQMACFTRPDAKTERWSYPIITPSAAIGVLEAVLWKPGLRWSITRIGATTQPKWMSVKRNEIKVPAISANGAIKPIDAEAQRSQRNSLLLVDVGYVIGAHLEISPRLDASHFGANLPGKYMAMFERRIDRGQYASAPYLGCREFPVDTIERVTHDEAHQLVDTTWTMPIGPMFTGWDFDSTKAPHLDYWREPSKRGDSPQATWANAQISNGWLDLDPLSSGEAVAA